MAHCGGWGGRGGGEARLAICPCHLRFVICLTSCQRGSGEARTGFPCIKRHLLLGGLSTWLVTVNTQQYCMCHRGCVALPWTAGRLACCFFRQFTYSCARRPDLPLCSSTSLVLQVLYGADLDSGEVGSGFPRAPPLGNR